MYVKIKLTVERGDSQRSIKIKMKTINGSGRVQRRLDLCERTATNEEANSV